MRRYPTGSRAQLDAGDIEFDIYKRARELMELSGLKMLPEQEVQAGGVHLWPLTRQGSTASNGYAIREYTCPMRHMYKHRGAGPCRLGADHANYADFSNLARPPKIKLRGFNPERWGME